MPPWLAVGAVLLPLLIAAAPAARLWTGAGGRPLLDVVVLLGCLVMAGLGVRALVRRR